MDLISNLIATVDEAGLRSNAYSTINSVVYYFSIIFGIVHGIKLRIKPLHVIIAVTAERLLAGYIASAILFVEDGFVSTGRANAVVAFPFIPVIGFIAAKILKAPYQKIWDAVMVSPIVMFIGARIACTITGCCRGYQCDWGIYNAITNETHFPIQLLEAFVSVLILAYVFYREKKNSFIPDGMNVPIILIMYGVSRFLLEFLHDNEKIVLGIASTQFHCLIMIAAGLIALAMLRKSVRKQQIEQIGNEE